MAPNFDLAPDPKNFGAFDAVPIDIESITAVFKFDGNTQSGTADATIIYTVGPTNGYPIFDLRQNITHAWLDGGPFSIADLAHQDFGGGIHTQLRLIRSEQAAGSIHTLRLKYSLGIPDSQTAGSYQPLFQWSAGTRLSLAFGFSDKYKSRYAEQWLPANLIFDQYSIHLEILIENTTEDHSIITNGLVTTLGVNHWEVDFPSHSTALSTLLELHPSDLLTKESDTVVLPVSGQTVNIDAWKLNASALNLTAQINSIKGLLVDNETEYGGYAHGDRFVAFFNGNSGMEYDGGTTLTSIAPYFTLRHETFHSWFGRGIKPAFPVDGWWDEGFTAFHDNGANETLPFDFTNPPVTLCSRDRWQRHTQDVDGLTFWKGIASLLGVPNFRAFMRQLYESYRGNPLTTEMIEEFLLTYSSEAQIVDAFHRFVYGFDDGSADLWLKDSPAHMGEETSSGVFWDSPDLWVRNSDDGIATHQSPKYGQDNWFYARVRNRGTGDAEHFVVTFHCKGFLGTQFVYPTDFIPCTTAKAGFCLPSGEDRIVKARWRKELIPAAGTHTCLLASIIARGDHPDPGDHVWEHNNLAQKNLVILETLPGEMIILPIVLSNRLPVADDRFELLLKSAEREEYVQVETGLFYRSKQFFELSDGKLEPFMLDEQAGNSSRQVRALDCGSQMPPTPSPSVPEQFHGGWEASLPVNAASGLTVAIARFSQVVVGLKITIPARAQAKACKLHFIQRHVATREILGGVAVELRITGKRKE